MSFPFRAGWIPGLLALCLLPLLCLPASGSNEEAERHAERSAVLFQQKRLPEALVAARRALVLREEALGAQHPAVLEDVQFLAFLLWQNGDVPAAADLFERGLALCKRLHGEQHEEYAEAVTYAAGFYQFAAIFDRAEALYREALRLHAALTPGDAKGAAELRKHLAEVYFFSAQYPEAALILRESITSLVAAGRGDSEAAIEALDALGDVQGRLEQLPEAKASYLRAAELRKKRYGEQDPRYATSLLHLADLDEQEAEFDAAKLKRLAALTLLRKAPGEKDAGYFNALSSIGSLYRRLGLLDEAAIALKQAAAGMEAAHPETPALTAGINLQLAIVYRQQGKPALAESLITENLEALQRRLSPSHPAVLAVLATQARAYLDAGQLDRAEKLYLELIRQQEGSRAAVRREQLDHQSNLAVIYSRTGRWEQAEAAFEAIEQADRKLLGAEYRPVRSATLLLNHVSVLTRLGRYDDAEKRLTALQQDYEAAPPELLARLRVSRASLRFAAATLYDRKGAAPKAEECYRKALAVLDAQPYGTDDLHVYTPGDLGLLLARSHRVSEALPLLCRAFERRMETALRPDVASSEESLLQYLGAHRGGADALWAALAAADSLDPKDEERALTLILRDKGLIEDAVYRWQAARRRLRTDPKLPGQLAQLGALRQRLSSLALRADGEATAETAALQERQRRLESQLNLALPAGGAGTGTQLTAVGLRKRLPAGSALVQFHRTFDYGIGKGAGRRWHYLAFVLSPDPAARVRPVDLGDADEVDALVADFRRDIERGGRSLERASQAARRTGEQEAVQSLRESSETLHQKLFAPLLPLLGSARRLYLCPDGELNRLPFEALVDRDGKYLIERYACAYLSSGRDLLRPAGAVAKGTVVFAGPDFDLQPAARAVTSVPAETTRGLSRDLRAMKWVALPGAAGEAADVQRTLQGSPYGPVRAFTGPQALEKALKHLPAPRLLHLATHGFYLPDQKLTPEDREARVDVRADSAAAVGLGRLRGVENPFLRSGLVLAGANRLGGAGEDGWVTAEEIATLDLRGTELVVLSACESGLGDIRCGEGVYGLRRAFQYAGARTLLMSLFKVPDAATRTLMQRVYAGLKAKQPKLTALRGAQLEVIRQRRAQNGAAHPFFWAGFILAGTPE